jgi:hypothetical protein
MAQRVGKNETAYSFREALFAEVIVGVDPDPANNAKITAWCKDHWDALHPYSAGGSYVNFMMERVRTAFGLCCKNSANESDRLQHIP